MLPLYSGSRVLTKNWDGRPVISSAGGIKTPHTKNSTGEQKKSDQKRPEIPEEKRAWIFIHVPPPGEDSGEGGGRNPKKVTPKTNHKTRLNSRNEVARRAQERLSRPEEGESESLRLSREGKTTPHTERI